MPSAPAFVQRFCEHFLHKHRRSSLSLGARFSIPIAIKRSVLCPTCMTVFTAIAWRSNHVAGEISFSKRATRVRLRKDSGQEVQPSQVEREQPRSRNCRRPPWRTPCRTFASASRLSGRVKSECVWMSMKPGARTRPVPSTFSRGGFGPSHLDRYIRPSRTATSTSCGAPPVPSMTVAPRINKSSMRYLSPGVKVEEPE